MQRWVYAGLGLAIVASFLAVFVFNQIGFDPENELFEGLLLAVAAIMVVSLVVWMFRTSKGMKKQVETRLESLAGAETGGGRYGLLAFVFLMVFREGIEIILFLAALSLTDTPDLASFIGGLAGLVLALVFAVLIVRGTLRINLRLFFAITGVVLFVLAIRLAAGSIHEFHEAGLLHLSHNLEEFIEFLTGDSTSTVILILLVALPMAAMLPKRWLRPAGRVWTRLTG
jgi:FTR1 family protein